MSTHSNLRTLTPEQVLIIAEEVCAATSAHIVDYVGLGAIAGATSARFHGLSAWEGQHHPAEYLQELVARIAPLSMGNDMFGYVLAQVVLATAF